jgi:hypothetical protein
VTSNRALLGKLEEKAVETSSVISLTDEEQELKALMKSSFKDFVISAWPYMDATPYIDNWHIDALCDHLQALYEGDIKRLIINIPPRCSKTLIGCIALPAWIWSKEPQHKFIYGSNKLALAEDSSLKCRDLIISPWYRHFFRDEFQLRKDNFGKRYFSNNKMGARLSVSVDSSVVGFGADTIFIDDGNCSKGVYSEVQRNASNTWIDSAVSSRINNPDKFRLVIQQQRLHEQDLSGYYLSKELKDTVHLFIPMEYESSRKCVTTFGEWEWSDPREKDCELLWPDRFNKQWVEITKKDMGSLIYAGQHQQRPSSADGTTFKDEWFGFWEEETSPECSFVIQSWDTALVGDDGKNPNKVCYSACTTWGVFEDENNIPNIILLNMWRGKVNFPDLRKMAHRLALNYHDTDINSPPLGEGMKPDVVLVEAKVSGFGLHDELRLLGIPVLKFNPNKYGNKMYRARSISALVEAGRVWLPAKPPKYDKLRSYAQTFLELCLKFPNDESNDVVDSMSQALIKIRESGWVKIPLDHIEEEKVEYFSDDPLY